MGVRDNSIEQIRFNKQQLKELAGSIFPALEESDPEGFVASGGALSTDLLITAYSAGIFPWYSEDEPILWWSPNPRLVLFPEKFKVSKSLQKKIRDGIFEVRFDSCFPEVIEACAITSRKGESGTWITPEMKEAYIGLHQEGYAHSVETFYEGKLAGGLYGVSLGHAFFGESMFHRVPDASKVALYYLVERMKEWKFDFIDSQITTQHLISLGAEEITREEYLLLLDKALEKNTFRGRW